MVNPFIITLRFSFVNGLMGPNLGFEPEYPI